MQARIFNGLDCQFVLDKTFISVVVCPSVHFVCAFGIKGNLKEIINIY
jgi:hypothetical protein